MKTLVISTIGIVCCCLAALVILFAHPDLTWHDQQRLAQIVISVLAFIGLLFLSIRRTVRLSATTFCAIVGIVFLGGCSCLLALHPFRAFLELALFLGCIGIGAFIFCVMREFGERADLIFGGFLRLLLAAMVFQFYVSFASALAHSDLYFTPWNLLHGFSNMRFQGQFLTIVAPLLGAALVLPKESNVAYPRRLDGFLLVSVACMIFVGGTRGTVAAWIVVAVGFACLKGGGRRLATRMIIVIAVGYLLALGMMQTISVVLGRPLEYRFAGSEVFGLSAREILWEHAWKTVLEHPWFGVGPMHFAALGNKIAAHPHQALLQIASEWGLPVLCLIVACVSRWLWRVYVGVAAEKENTNSELRWALLFSVLSSIVQSMVDGVLVMPYPQLWLAIMAGWCSARCLPALVTEKVVALPAVVLSMILSAAIAVLIVAAVIDYPSLLGVSEYCGLGPRFWCNGRI